MQWNISKLWVVYCIARHGNYLHCCHYIFSICIKGAKMKICSSQIFFYRCNPQINFKAWNEKNIWFPHDLPTFCKYFDSKMIELFITIWRNQNKSMTVEHLSLFRVITVASCGIEWNRTELVHALEYIYIGITKWSNTSDKKEKW